jgi:Holliday junction resolvasome RuvABC endonuclease subunit
MTVQTTKLDRTQVLGLDIATHCGYHSTHESGTWDFTESLRRNNNKQHEAFRVTLMDFITKYGIRQIVAEDVTAGQAKGGFKSSIKLAEFRGILLEVCDTLNLPEPVFINLRTIKKWATGDGNADKKKMIEYCKRRWGIEPIDDNESDAIHIYMYYVRINNIPHKIE